MSLASDRVRYHRQMLCDGVGEAGQSRIAQATAHVGGHGLAHEVACRYAAGAGFAAVEHGPLDTDQLAPPFITLAAPRAVLAGARAALAAMRQALFS